MAGPSCLSVCPSGPLLLLNQSLPTHMSILTHGRVLIHIQKVLLTLQRPTQTLSSPSQWSLSVSPSSLVLRHLFCIHLSQSISIAVIICV